jgi:hypothetical protein
MVECWVEDLAVDLAAEWRVRRAVVVVAAEAEAEVEGVAGEEVGAAGEEAEEAAATASGTPAAAYPAASRRPPCHHPATGLAACR